MGKFFEQLANTAGNAVTGGIFGIASGAIGNAMQIGQQRRLTRQQIDAQKELTDYNMKKQLEMWEKTGYGAQVLQLKEAGLNPALLYGMGGAGGQSTDVKTGNASGGQAQNQAGTIQAAMAMGLQMQNMEAQRKLMEAQARNLDVNSDKTAGVDTAEATARIGEITARTGNIKADEYLKTIQGKIAEIDLKIKAATADNSINIVTEEYNKLAAEARQELAQAKVDEKTINARISMIKAQAVDAWLKTELTRAQTDKTRSDITINEAQINKWSEEIAQGWQKLALESYGLGIEEQKAAISKFQAETQRNYPTVYQVAGNMHQRFQEFLSKLFNFEYTPQKVK